MSSEYTPLFSKGLDRHFGLAYPLYSSRIPDIFHTDMISARVEDRQGWTSYLNLPESRLPGEQITMNEFAADFGKRYIVGNYGTGDVLPQEDYDDDQYGFLAREIPAKGGALARLFNLLEEYVASSYFTTLGYVSGTSVAGSPDGVSLFNTAHPQSLVNSATTVANRPSVDVDLSAASLQDACTALSLQTASSGLEFIDNPARILVANPKNRFVVKQLLRGQWEMDSANRNQNFLTEEGIRPVMWPYFRSSGTVGAGTSAYNSWFLVGATHFLTFLRRQSTQIRADFSILSLSHIYVAYSRFVLGHDSWRGTYGSQGA